MIHQNTHINSIKSIKFCYFRSRIKKFGLIDWKETLDKVSWNTKWGKELIYTLLTLIVRALGPESGLLQVIWSIGFTSLSLPLPFHVYAKHKSSRCFSLWEKIGLKWFWMSFFILSLSLSLFFLRLDEVPPRCWTKFSQHGRNYPAPNGHWQECSIAYQWNYVGSRVVNLSAIGGRWPQPVCVGRTKMTESCLESRLHIKRACLAKFPQATL